MPGEPSDPEDPSWSDEPVEAWGPRHPRTVKVTALVLAVALALLGMSTVLQIVLNSH